MTLNRDDLEPPSTSLS